MQLENFEVAHHGGLIGRLQKKCFGTLNKENGHQHIMKGEGGWYLNLLNGSLPEEKKQLFQYCNAIVEEHRSVGINVSGMPTQQSSESSNLHNQLRTKKLNHKYSDQEDIVANPKPPTGRMSSRSQIATLSKREKIFILFLK